MSWLVGVWWVWTRRGVGGDKGMRGQGDEGQWDGEGWEPPGRGGERDKRCGT